MGEFGCRGECALLSEGIGSNLGTGVNLEGGVDADIIISDNLLPLRWESAYSCG